MTRPTPGAVTSTTSYGAAGWWERAACRNADPDAFTPPPNEYRAMTHAESAYARSYCVRCPVAPECLKDALDKGDDYGIRGGVDMATRNKRSRAKRSEAA